MGERDSPKERERRRGTRREREKERREKYGDWDEVERTDGQAWQQGVCVPPKVAVCRVGA